MPNEMQRLARRVPRFLCNHNPLYLVSAWLVLHGIGQAFHGSVGMRWMPLMTQLLCGYTLALAFAGWLVVRLGKVWEDARMILLVLLLMFTGLSISYDDQCLKDPVAGAQHLAICFAFCCGITELVLFTLGMKLPLRYRIPFYLQLAVLFAFPAWLGKLSVEGRDPEMGGGVLIFPVAAAVALLSLLPAANGAPERDNGTPWPWPFYPWSIFVFMAIASGIRSWMLSVSFSPAAGVGPAFLPYFLCPILLSMLVLMLEMGLRLQSKAAQRTALVAMLGVIWMAFPGEQLNSAQRILLDLMEGTFAGPPLLVCGSVAAIAVYAMLRQAAGSEPVAVIALILFACIDFDTRATNTLHTPLSVALLALAGWQLVSGIMSRTTLRLAFGGIGALIILSRIPNAPSWMVTNNSLWFLALTWCAMLPLICRDALAEWLRSRSNVDRDCRNLDGDHRTHPLVFGDCLAVCCNYN